MGLVSNHQNNQICKNSPVCIGGIYTLRREVVELLKVGIPIVNRQMLVL